MPREDLSLNKNGVPDLIVTLMLVLFALAARKLENVAVESIDTAQQTPQDYSVGILFFCFRTRLVYLVVQFMSFIRVPVTAVAF